MVGENNIDIQVMTYGVAVHGDTDSGWKTTGFTPGLDEATSLKLETLTSVGEISEAWAGIFGHGFAYYGGMKDEDRAVFALFYRSPVKSARGRHFVPRIVLTMPFRDYVEELQCDPDILFELLIKYKNEKAPEICEIEPMTLDPFYDVLSLPARTLEKQLQPLTQAINAGTVKREFLIDFLTAVLRPQPHNTLIWGGEKPDSPLILSTIFLLPPILRRFITFCTSVESPRVGDFRIKIIKDPVSPGDNSFAVMKENMFTVSKSRISFSTQLPEIIVDEFMSPNSAGIMNLKEMHRFIQSKFEVEPGTDFMEILRKIEVLTALYLLRKQVISTSQPHEVYKRLLEYASNLKTLREAKIQVEESDFIAQQFERGVLEIKREDQVDDVLEITEVLQQLVRLLPDLEKAEIQRLSDALFAKGSKFSLTIFLSLLEAFYIIPSLKETIASELFNKLKLKYDPNWEESFQLLTMVQDDAQCKQLKEKNKKLYNQLKKQPGIDYFIDLLSLLSPSKKLNKNLVTAACKKIEKVGDEDKDKIHKITYFGLQRLGEFEPGVNHFPLLLIAARSYAFTSSLGTEAQLEFQTQFKQQFSQVCNLEIGQQKKKLPQKIINKIGAVDHPFANQLEAIMRQSDFSRNLAACSHLLLPKGGAAPFADKEDISRLLRQFDDDKSFKHQRYLSTAAVQLIIGRKTPPPSTLYAGYLDYLENKKTMDDTDIQNVTAILTSDPSPMATPRNLLDTLNLAFSSRSEQSLSRFIRFLLSVAKKYARDYRYISTIDTPFSMSVNENWKPSKCEELREIYQAVYDGFGKSVGNRILWLGIQRLPETERMKYLITVLTEFFDEFSITGREDLEYFKDLLNYIENGNPETLSMLMEINAELLELKEGKDAIENSIDNIKALLKKLKKFR